MPPVRKKVIAEVHSPTLSSRSTRSSASTLSPRSTTRTSPRGQSGKNFTSESKPSTKSPRGKQGVSTNIEIASHAVRQSSRGKTATVGPSRSSPITISETEISSSQPEKENKSDKEITQNNIRNDASGDTCNEYVSPRSRGRPRNSGLNEVTRKVNPPEDENSVRSTPVNDKMQTVEGKEIDDCVEDLTSHDFMKQTNEEDTKEKDSKKEHEEESTKSKDTDNLIESSKDTLEEVKDSAKNLKEATDNNTTSLNELVPESSENLNEKSKPEITFTSRSNSSCMITSGTQTRLQPVKRKMSPAPVEPPDKKNKVEPPSVMMSPRKSSRQVKMSRWFEDMEVSFGKDKKQKKTQEVTSAKSGRKRKSTDKTKSKEVKTEIVVVYPATKINKGSIRESEDRSNQELGKVQERSITETATLQSEPVTAVQSLSLTTVQHETNDESKLGSVVPGESVKTAVEESSSPVEAPPQTDTKVVVETTPEEIEKRTDVIPLPVSGRDLQTKQVDIAEQSSTEPAPKTIQIHNSSSVNSEVTERLLSSDLQAATEAEVKTHTDLQMDNRQCVEAECKPIEDEENCVYSNLTYTRVLPEEVDADPLLKTISVDIQTEPSTAHSKKQEFVIVRLPEGTPIHPDSIVDKKKMAEEEGVQCEVNLAEGTFSCTECTYVTNKKTNWYKHKKKHMGVKPYICDMCDYKSSTSSNLKRHMGIHRDVRKHACERCGLMFRQKIHLERHIKYKHEEKSVQCPLCDYVCANENPDLKVHIKRRHNRTTEIASSEMFTCEECGLIAVSKKDYKQHIKFHRKGPELKLFCELCSFVTDCESRMNRHMMIHTKEKPYQCGMCDYRGTQREHVIRHMKSQHQVDIPEKVQSSTETKTGEDSELLEGKLSEDNLSNHSTPSSSDPEKKYDKADFSTRDKIFACNHCTMKFAKLINLYKHLHTQHKNIMPNSMEEFSCVVCEFKTNSKKNLLVHMRKHNLLDQSPPTHVYSCVLCSYVNPKRRNLFQHMKKKHKIEIVMKDDGSANCFIAENSNLTGEARNENLMTVGDIVTASTSDTQIQFVAGTGTSGSVQRLVSISDLANAIALPQNTDGVVYIDQTNGAKAVTEMDLADLQVESINVQHEAAEAIQGLQALAEQSQRHILETPLTIDPLSGINAETSVEIGEQILTEQVVEEPQVVEDSQVVEVSQAECNVEFTEEAISNDDEDRPSIQLSSDQLMNLSSGDYVEINGEMYKVEFTTEPSSS